MLLAREDIGGGVVRRTFKYGDRTVTSGTKLTRGEILVLPYRNLNALVEKRFIEVYPRIEDYQAESKRIVASKGFGKYDVIEGRVIGEGMSKDAAEALAADLN